MTTRSGSTRDVCVENQVASELAFYRQELYGMRWCQDELQLVSRGNDVEVLVWNAATLDSARGAAAPPRGALDRLAGRSSECSPLAADDRNYGGQRQCRRWQPRSSGSFSRVCSGSIGSSGPPTVASDPALTPGGVPQGEQVGGLAAAVARACCAGASTAAGGLTLALPSFLLPSLSASLWRERRSPAQRCRLLQPTRLAP